MGKNEISMIVGGEAGAGVTRSGFLFAKACLRGGLHVFGTNDYQSLIRGGHNFYQVRAGADEVYSQWDTIHLLLALNKETILLHAEKLVAGGGVVYDDGEIDLESEELGRGGAKPYPVPLRDLVNEVDGPLIMRNTVALGAAVALLGFDLNLLEEALEDTFEAEVAESNIKAAEKGHNYALEGYAKNFEYRLERKVSAGEGRILLTGSEATGLGALRAGCKFYAAYPMTPATPLLHFLAPLEREYDMIVMRPESEIAAINLAVGASFAGARAMTATSGGGFCLMSEGLGLAAMTETPLVIMLAQRPGPSTGLPTYTGQGDLQFTIHASQGEFPRIVIAPGDVEECFYQTGKAFNLAERFQVPVILITDKYLFESHGEAQAFDQEEILVERDSTLLQDEYRGEREYMRHRLTDDGVSPKAVPGVEGAIVRTNSNEHDERGYTTDDPELATKMADKRFRKLNSIRRELKTHETTRIYGPEEGEATILSWGSTKGPIREALKLLGEDGLEVNFLQVVFLNPFPATKVTGVLESAEKTIVLENNKTSQLTSLIREHLLLKVDHQILKYDGRPFNPRELANRVEEVL